MAHRKVKRNEKRFKKDLITYVDKPTHQGRVRVRAKVREHRPAQGQARQAKSKKANRYVVKVINSNREGGQVFWFAITKGCPEPFYWSIIFNLCLF